MDSLIFATTKDINNEDPSHKVKDKMQSQHALLHSLSEIRANLTEDEPKSDVALSDDPFGLHEHLVDESSPQCDLQRLVCEQIGQHVLNKNSRPMVKSASSHTSRLNRRTSVGSRSPSLKRANFSEDDTELQTKKPKSRLPTSK